MTAFCKFMKYNLTALLIAMIAWHSTVSAQDGLVFSAQPPIVVRFDGRVHFTNTSEKVLHGVTVNNKDDKGNKTSKVIIDTIEPHKTVTIDLAVEFLANNPTLTCTNYSKPLPVNLIPTTTK
jgi:hypothetical protein